MNGTRGETTQEKWNDSLEKQQNMKLFLVAVSKLEILNRTKLLNLRCNSDATVNDDTVGDEHGEGSDEGDHRQTGGIHDSEGWEIPLIVDPVGIVKEIDRLIFQMFGIQLIHQSQISRTRGKKPGDKDKSQEWEGCEFVIVANYCISVNKTNTGRKNVVSI